MTDGLITIIDALQALVEPDPETGPTIDDAASQPFDFAGNTLYAWEENSMRRSIGTGGEVREDFTIVLVYCSEAAEEAWSQRSREISIALDAKRTAYLDAIRSHEGVGPWGYISGASDPDFVRAFEVRGIAVRVTGWRILD